MYLTLSFTVPAEKMFLQTWILLLLLSLCYGDDLEEGCVDISMNPNVRNPPRVVKVTERGNLYSPGFLEKKDYPNDVQCSYQLITQKGWHIRLHFNTLDIDITDTCASDAVSIYDFNEAGQGVVMSILCGNSTPYDIVSEISAIQVTLRTDSFGAGRGFNITYTPQNSKKVCATGEKQCRNRNCVDYLLVCDGNDDCGDGTDEEKCIGVVSPSVECGKPDITPVDFSDGDRIVGGREAIQGSWPWMADLQWKMIQPNGHTCGGSLINSQWVLTAAHCFTDFRRPSDWRIHIGNHHKYKKDPHEQVRYAERIIIYDNIPASVFERDGEFDMVNDMALIKLNAPVKFSEHVRPVCLPDPLTTLDIFTNCYHSGWGVTRGSGSSDVLKQAYHPVQRDYLCQRLVGRDFNPRTMICAGSMAPLNGACHGDSGGPLVCETKTGKWSIFGVASYVTDSNMEEGLCGLKGRPTVFNRVSVKNAWIRKMINLYG